MFTSSRPEVSTQKGVMPIDLPAAPASTTVSVRCDRHHPRQSCVWGAQGQRDPASEPRRSRLPNSRPDLRSPPRCPCLGVYPRFNVKKPPGRWHRLFLPFICAFSMINTSAFRSLPFTSTEILLEGYRAAQDSLIVRARARLRFLPLEPFRFSRANHLKQNHRSLIRASPETKLRLAVAGVIRDDNTLAYI